MQNCLSLSMPQPSCPRAQRGVTLLELIVAMTILAATAAFAVPSYQDFVKNQRLVAGANELLTSLTLARSTAISTRAPTVICRTSAPDAATPVCGTGAFWEQGWVVYTDNNDDGIVDADEIVWERHPALPGEIEIGALGNIANRVRFLPIGTSPGFNGTFAICDDRKGNDQIRERMREVVIAVAGRARVEKGDGATPCR